MGYGDDIVWGCRTTPEEERRTLERYSLWRSAQEALLAVWEVNREEIRTVLENLAQVWMDELSGVKLTLEARGTGEGEPCRFRAELPEGVQCALVELRAFAVARDALLHNGGRAEAFAEALVEQPGPVYSFEIREEPDEAARDIVHRAMNVPKDLRRYASSGEDRVRVALARLDQDIDLHRRVLAHLEA